MSRVPECGHPDRAHMAKGMCAQCYYKQHDKKRYDARKDGQRRANAPGKPVRMAECHPDRPHWAKGLCGSCYMRQRTNSVKAICHPTRPHVARGLCSACISKEQYDQDPEKARQQARDSGKRMRAKLRDELIEAYGGKCSCQRCPETNPVFLTLEHVGGGGRAHRKAVGSHSYADLRRRGFPQEGYTLLCWNCNAASRHTGVCPHMLDE